MTLSSGASINSSYDKHIRTGAEDLGPCSGWETPCNSGHLTAFTFTSGGSSYADVSEVSGACSAHASLLY